MKKCVVCGQMNADDAAFCENCQSTSFENIEICPKCRMPKEDNSDFCSSCGFMFQPKKLFDSAELVQCKTCGIEIPAMSVFCPVCGKTVGEEGKRTIKKLVCSICGKLNDLNSEYCSYCFFDLSNTEPKELQIVMNSKNKDGLTANQCVLVDDGGAATQIICPACEALNETDEKYCIKCGQSLKTEVPAKYCTACGAENPSDAAFCVNCQNSLFGRPH